VLELNIQTAGKMNRLERAAGRFAAIGAVVLLVAVAMSGCQSKTNAVVAYFDGATMKCANDSQCVYITGAFNDAQTMSADQLKQQRYPDYAGKPGQWDLVTIINNYVVPTGAGKTLGNNFYRDVTTPAGRRALLDFLKRNAPPSSPTAKP